MAIQYILACIILFAALRTYLQYKQRHLAAIELFFWFLFWSTSLFVVFRPEATTVLADLVGVGRGADLVIYISLIVLFYTIFRMFIRIRALQHDLSKIITELAIRDHKDDE